MRNSADLVVTDFKLAFGIQYYSTSVSRTEYDNLRTILQIVKNGNTASLPRSLSTLTAHTKGSFPLLELRLKSMPVSAIKQATMSARAKEGNQRGNIENLYFFNLILLFQAYLSTNSIRTKMYTSLGQFVDVPAELQELNIQHSSIRISSSQFASYPRQYVTLT